MLYIQDFLIEVLELVIKLLQGVRVFIETMLVHLSSDTISSLLGSLTSIILRMPRLVWFSVNITEGSDVVNTAFHNFTSGTSGSLMDIIGPRNGTSSITYILNATLYTGNAEIGPRFLVALFDFIAAILVAVAEFMQRLPVIFPWG
ncbi:MAG: hypothetical protein SVM80_04080 [Halobacteriota archaeon]|nr:hypothetical protein [Halobacteriota archaeon]